MAPLKDNMKEAKEKGKKVLKSLSQKENHGQNAPPMRPWREFVNNAMGMLFIFFVLMTIYSFLAEKRKDTASVSISEVAADVARGDVAEIKVAGEKLTIIYGKGNI